MRLREPCAGMTMEQYRLFGAARVTVDDLRVRQYFAWVNKPPTFAGAISGRRSPSDDYTLFVAVDTDTIIRVVHR